MHFLLIRLLAILQACYQYVTRACVRGPQYFVMS